MSARPWASSPKRASPRSSPGTKTPSSTPSWVVTDVFGAAPTELTRSISLQKALGLLRTIVEVVESQVPDIAPEAEQAALREAVLRYSREVAFAAADVYAWRR